MNVSNLFDPNSITLHGVVDKSDCQVHFERDGHTAFFNPKTLEIVNGTSFIYNTEKQVVDNSIQRRKVGFQFQVVHACNLKCTYCSVNQGNFAASKDVKEEKILKFGVAKAAIDIFLKTYTNVDTISVLFYGGEPFMVPNVIDEIASYIVTVASKYGAKCHFRVVTNGTLITERVLKLIEAYSIDVQISVDGSEEVHNIKRPYISGRGSYLDVVKGIQKLATIPRIRMHILAVLPPNDRDILSTLQQLEKSFNGIPVKIRQETPTCSTNGERMQEEIMGNTDYGVELANSYQRVALAIVSDLNKGAGLNGIKSKISLFGSELSTLYWKTKHTRFCAVGISQLSVGPDGKLFPCHTYPVIQTRQCGQVTEDGDSHLDMSVLKNIDEVLDVDNRHPCKECWARYLCGGYCSVVSDQFEGDASHAWTGACNAIRGRISAAIWLYSVLSKQFPWILFENYIAPSLISHQDVILQHDKL